MRDAQHPRDEGVLAGIAKDLHGWDGRGVGQEDNNKQHCTQQSCEMAIEKMKETVSHVHSFVARAD